MPTEDSEFGREVISADGVFLPALRDRRYTANDLKRMLLETLRRMFEPELAEEGGVTLREAHETFVAQLTPLWMEAALTRGLVELEQPPAGAAEVFRVSEAHLKLTEDGRKKLAEIERDWPVIPLATAAQARSWVLERTFNVLFAIAGASALTVTVAVQNLRKTPITWVVLVLLFAFVFYALWQRWQRVQRTRRAYYYYWLYRGNRRNFERAHEETATDFSHILETLDTLGKQTDLARRVTDHRARQIEEKHDARMREIAAWRDASLQEIKQKYKPEAEAASAPRPPSAPPNGGSTGRCPGAGSVMWPDS